MCNQIFLGAYGGQEINHFEKRNQKKKNYMKVYYADFYFTKSQFFIHLHLVYDDLKSVLLSY